MVELSPLRQLRMGQPAEDGVVVRPAAAGAHRRAHHRLLGVRPVRRPAPDAGGHRPRRGQGPVARYDYRDLNAGDPQQVHRLRRDRRLLDRLRRRRGRRLRAHLHDGLPAGPGQPRRARRRQAAARRDPDHGRRPVLPAGDARGIQEAPAAALQLGIHASPSPTASCSPSPATTTGTTASTLSTACSAPRATSSPTPSGNVIGGWQCQQHRSYWALRLPYNWWIWGADIQFSKYLDTAQVNYFERRGRADGPAGQPDHLPGRAVAG